MKKFRYPGPFPFATDQEEIFCGRETETDQLYTKILANQTIVLHARSGTGKSSLVNAGLIPELKRNNPEFIPITICFQGIKKDETNKVNLEDANDNALIKETIAAIKPYITNTGTVIPYLLKQENDLWYWAKLLQHSGKNFLLIFDQFENIESYRFEQIVEFKKNLAQLFNSKMPAAYFRYFKEQSPAFSNTVLLVENSEESEKYNIDAAFIKESPDTKALFVIKDEKLGVMSLLSDCFPDILKNDYLLQMLESEGAKNAIKVPAMKEGEFASPGIDFDDEAIAFLQKNLADEDTKRIDPLEIQVICSYVEKKIIRDFENKELVADPDSGMVKIHKEYFPDIKDIVNFFYLDCWNQVRPPGITGIAFEKIRSEIIKDFVIGSKRIPVYINIFSLPNRDIIHELRKTGLIRNAVVEDFYQICHDRFIKPLLDDKADLEIKANADRNAIEEKEALEKRLLKAEEDKKNMELEQQLKKAVEEKEKFQLEQRLVEAEAEKKKIELENKLIETKLTADKLALQNQINKNTLAASLKENKTNRKRVIVWSVFSVLFLLCAAVAIIIAVKKQHGEKDAKTDKYLMISRFLKRANNPTLSYLVASDWFKKNSDSDSMNKYLKEFDTSNYIYLSGIYPSITGIVAANIDKANRLVITEAENLSVWDLKNGIMIDRKKTDGQAPFKQIRDLNGRLLNAFDTKGLVTISDDQNTTVARIKTELNTNKYNIAISPDNRYVLIGNKIFDNKNPATALTINPYGNKNDKGIMEIYIQTAGYFLSNTRFAGAYENGDILIYDIGENIRGKISVSDTLESNEEEANIVTMLYNPDNQYLFANNSKNGINIWDLSEVRKSHSYDFQLEGHTGLVNDMAFSSDKKLLISGSEDNTAIIWNINNKNKVEKLKMPGASGIRYVNFLHGDKDIIAISDDFSGTDKVYLWKNERPAVLNTNKQLYRFSQFDYAILGLNQYVDGLLDTVSTKELYKATLNYYLNIPLDNEYPDEASYSQALTNALAQVKEMYKNLLNRKDYHREIAGYNDDLLKRYYLDHLSKIDRDIININSKIEGWRNFLLDTTKKVSIGFGEGFSIVGYISGRSSSYFDKDNNYTDGIRLINFYRDSFYNKLIEQNKNRKNPNLQKVGHNINIALLKYYLYTGKTNDALKIAVEISHDTSRIINYSIYLIATYLVADKYADAAQLYNDINNNKAANKRSKALNSFNLNLFLLKIKAKNIAVSNINRFINDVKLNTAAAF